MARTITTRELAAQIDRIADTQEIMLLSLGETRTIVSAIDARCKERDKRCSLIQGEIARTDRTVERVREQKCEPLLADIRWGKNRYVKIGAALAGAGGLGLALAKWISTIVR
jgi:hypothetical protein